MSEQDSAPADDLTTLLTEAGPDAYVLAYADTVINPAVWDAPPPVAGYPGAVYSPAGLASIEVQEVCRGQEETLHRWLQLDDGQRQLVIITAGTGVLAEYTPGELAAPLLLAGTASNEAQVIDWLSNWLYRRSAETPHGQELGWVVAAAAWACHMVALSNSPLPQVLSQVVARTGELDKPTRELVVTTGQQLIELLDRMEQRYQPREELVKDWRAVEKLSADMPILKASTDWLLDQIALRDAQAQQLRAVLEPDISDHLRDRLQGGASAGDVPVPALDAQRTAQLMEARKTVRAYTAAAYSGRHQDAQQLLDAFPRPARALDVSAPAHAWRQRSSSAQQAAGILATQHEAAMPLDDSRHLVDPERLHAATVYLGVREAWLGQLHDALGRFAAPLPAPPNLPDGLLKVTSALPQRRLTEAYGSVERAREALDGQIAYLQQQPTPRHRQKETPVELALLQTVRAALDPEPPVAYDEDAIRRRLEEIRPVITAASWRPPTAPDQQHRVHRQQPHALGPDTSTGGLRP
ncbi:hypothetical protein ABZ864_47700 [Streptomyces sp. NPDC047082]|uniref:hypothetical protein n=1 Tax=Streptomyces sp. NPDC047082 TaxID=3155259 RepID=UPI0033D199E6